MKLGRVIAWGVVTAIGAFGVYAAIGARALMSVCYNMVKYQVQNITGDAIYINFTLKVNNPSFLAVDINGYKIDVFLNSKFIATVASTAHEEIVSKGVSTLIIPLKVAYMKAMGTVNGKELLNNFANQRFEKIVVSLKGTFKGTVLKVPVGVPIDQKWTLKEINDIMMAPNTEPPCKT